MTAMLWRQKETLKAQRRSLRQQIVDLLGDGIGRTAVQIADALVERGAHVRRSTIINLCSEMRDDRRIVRVREGASHVYRRAVLAK